MFRPIKNKAQYEDALARVYDLMQKNLKPESKDSTNWKFCPFLLKNTNKNIILCPNPSPLEAIKFRLEQMGMSEAELAHILGYRSRKSEILSGKRKLSLTMIRKLNEILHIPAEVLIQAY